MSSDPFHCPQCDTELDMNSRSSLGRYGHQRTTVPAMPAEEKPGNLRSCGCARRFQQPSPPPINGSPVGRSRSSTSSSAGGGGGGIGVTKSRSRTPSNLSSGRTTPSPTRSRNSVRHGMGDRTVSESALLNLQEQSATSRPRFVSTFQLKPRSLSAQYTTTVLIRISPSRRHHIEEIKYELRLTPNKIQSEVVSKEKKSTQSQSPSKQRTTRFKTEFEVELHKGDMTLIKIHQPTKQCVNDDQFQKTDSKENLQEDINEPECSKNNL